MGEYYLILPRPYLSYCNHNLPLLLSLLYAISYKEAYMPWKDLALIAVSILVLVIEQASKKK